MNADDRPERLERPEGAATQTLDRDTPPRNVPDRERAESHDRDDADDAFLPPDRMDDLRRRWNEIQAGFVDDPKTAVERAHALVASTVNELTEIFTRERANLEGQWNRGEQADTETLRVALTRYRVFFNRLLRSDSDDRH